MKVAVGISGGVDSAVAALLLHEQGRDVVAVTMTLGRPDDDLSVTAARRVAQQLDLPFEVCDLSHAWQSRVCGYVRDTYLRGQTPNPCVYCNENVKFGLFAEFCFSGLRADRFATGHYARLQVEGPVPISGLGSVPKGEGPVPISGLGSVPKGEGPVPISGLGSVPKVGGSVPISGVGTGPDGGCENEWILGENVHLMRGIDKGKDQSYFLYRVRPEVLARTIFPLGGMTKAEVREVARVRGLTVGDSPDSQDFCGGDPMEIVGAADRPGEVVTEDGRVLGTHRGYWHYTVGMRKGLGIGGGTPFYVLRLDAARNRVIVGPRAAAVRHDLRLTDCVGTIDKTLPVKVRSAGEPQLLADGIAGVAPGQSAVFYRGDEVVGGGIIAPDDAVI